MPKITAPTFRRIILIYLIAIGLVTGAFAAIFIHAAGRNIFAAIFVGIFCGICGTGSAFLFFLAGLRFIWLVRYVRHIRKQP